MPDGQQLSAQDMQDLRDIATHLPAGHPMQNKLNVLLNSQPTQMEQDNSATAPQSFYQKLTAPIDPTADAFDAQHPVAGKVARGLSSVGGTVIGAPEAAINTLSDLVKTYFHPWEPNKTIESIGGVADSAKSWADPETRPSLEGTMSVLPEALGQGVGNYAAGEIGNKGASIAKDFLPNSIGGGMKNVGQEIMNEGPSKLRVLEDNHAHATAAQKHVAEVAKAVHDDAQSAMSEVAQKIDGPTPEGIFDKADVSNRVADAIGDTADPSTLPKSIRDLLPGDGLDSVRKSTGPAVGGRHFDLSNPNDLKAFQKMKEQGVFSDEELARMEGTGNAGEAHTFGELSQIRSTVGKQMQSLQGPPQAAASAVYKELSTMLREGARNAGVEPDWVDANARWKGYMDDFQRSPLKKTLEGDNAHDIMEPLASDKTRVQVRDILAKYKPFGADVDTLGQEVGRWNFNNKIDRLGQPSKWTVLGAMVSPKAAALKTGAATALRNPKVTSAVMGEGFKAPKITPKMVYPTKEAAMRALKGKE